MVHRHNIPDTIEPETDITVCVPLPNDPTYIAAFLFTLKQMTLDRFWKRTPDLEAITVRNVMLNRTLKPVLDRLANSEYCGDIMACEDIADCIETSADVQDAITNYNDFYGTQNPDYISPEGTESEILDTRFPPSERDNPAASAPEDCDLDELWSGIYFMVQKLDETGRDWLEQAVASGDKWQRAASIVRNIPVIGTLASTALEQLAEVAQDLLNLYNGYSTEASIQEIACALFESVCDECRYPTFDEIIDYYKSNSTITTENIAEITIKALVDFLIGSSLAIAQLAYHTIIMFVLYTLYIGSTFVGLRGTKWITIWLDNGEEFANDEWEVLCDGCANAVWCYEWDFTASNGGMVLHNPHGTPAGEWESGVGWKFTDEALAGFNYRAITIRTPVWTSFASNITEWYWEGDYDFGHFEVGGANPDLTSMNAMSNSNNAILYYDSVTTCAVPSYSGEPISHMRDGLRSQTGTFFWWQWYSSNDNQSPATVSGNVVIRKLRLKGTGDMPPFTGGAEC